MLESLYFPPPLKHLYRNKEDKEEVVLIYNNIQSFDTTPDAEYMIDSVLFVGEDEIPVCYPKFKWEEEYEVVPVSISLFDEA